MLWLSGGKRKALQLQDPLHRCCSRKIAREFFEDRRSKRVTNDGEGKTVTRAALQHKGIQHRSPDESAVCRFSGCFIKSSIKPCFGAPGLVKLVKKSIKLMLQLAEVAMWVGCGLASFETVAQYAALTTNVHCTEHLHELVISYFQ